VLPFFPLEYGLLTGKYRRGQDAPSGSRAALDPARSSWLQEADWDRIEALEAFAAERGVRILDVAIGGLAAMPAVGSVIAGATRPEQVAANVRAGLWQPTEEDLEALAGVNRDRGAGMTHASFTRR
jgi:aryl-alcohol dehydrogenase-like predicted oxidoreductase